MIYREQTIRKANVDTSELDENTLVKRPNLIFISTFPNKVDHSIRELNNLISTGKKEECFTKFELDSQDLRRLESENEVKIKITDQHLVVSGMRDNVDKVKTELLNININGQKKMKYPDNWASSTNERLIELNKHSKEYQDIYNRIIKTVPTFVIAKIERIQNKHLWKYYQNQIEFLKDKGSPINEKFLFHGSAVLRVPDLLYDGEIGFQMQFSNAGMWGRGIYFAENASYSKSGYAFNNSDGTHSLFLARVALGDFIEQPSNNSYVLPPEKPQGNKQFAKARYDSIKGYTGGSDVYIIYENGRAYPEYLITFTS